VVVQNVLVGLPSALQGRSKLHAPVKQIVSDFCTVNPSDRVGYIGGIDEISEHPFFADLDHSSVVSQRVKAPFMPAKKKADLSLKPKPLEVPEDLYVNHGADRCDAMWDLDF
jgi:hypothetical protein